METFLGIDALKKGKKGVCEGVGGGDGKGKEEADKNGGKHVKNAKLRGRKLEEAVNRGKGQISAPRADMVLQGTGHNKRWCKAGKRKKGGLKGRYGKGDKGEITFVRWEKKKHNARTLKKKKKENEGD